MNDAHKYSSRRAEELFEQRNHEMLINDLHAEAEASRPHVANFHLLLPMATENLARLDYPVPSVLLNYQGERRVAWTLYKQYDTNLETYLLADGEVVFNSINPEHFDVNDLLNPEMQTNLRYKISPGFRRWDGLSHMNDALTDIASIDAERVRAYQRKSYYPPSF